MAKRTETAQSDHDAAVRALAELYKQKHKEKNVWINPDGEKNKSWAGRYIDVIVADKVDKDSAWLIEIETADSVNDTEAESQWKYYDSVYTKDWNLSIPVECLKDAVALVQKYKLENCFILPWRKYSDGTYRFYGLPGL